MSKAEAFTQNAHPHTDKDDFRTPAYLFDWINDTFGPVEYDAACHEDGSNALAWPLRLEDEWPADAIIYTNPPFDSESIVKWFDKGREHADNGGVHIMCLPNKICQTFFTERIALCNEIWMLGGRVDFSGPYSTSGGTSRTGTMIIIQRYTPSTHHPIVRGIRLKDLKKRFKDKEDRYAE